MDVSYSYGDRGEVALTLAHNIGHADAEYLAPWPGQIVTDTLDLGLHNADVKILCTITNYDQASDSLRLWIPQHRHRRVGESPQTVFGARFRQI